jgi:ribose transport system permease protein
MIGFRGLARWISRNSNIGLSFDEQHVSGQFTSVFAQPEVVIGIFLAMSLLFALVLSRTVFGRYVRALGDNLTAAKYAGLPLRRMQVAVYSVAGAMAGLAGVIHCAQNRQGNPNDGMAYELDAIAAVVIGGTSLQGGKGSILGTLVGTLTLGVITNILGLKGVDENVKWMAKALIILVAVLVQQPETYQKLFRALQRLRRVDA